MGATRRPQESDGLGLCSFAIVLRRRGDNTRTSNFMQDEDRRIVEQDDFQDAFAPRRHLHDRFLCYPRDSKRGWKLAVIFRRL